MTHGNHKLPFAKLEALANDFVLIEQADAHQLDVATLHPLADRRLGVGCDQVLLLEPRAGEWALRILNNDGTEAEQCGNGLRAVACWLHHQHQAGQASAPPWRLITAAGPCILEAADGVADGVTNNGQWRTTLPGLRRVETDLSQVALPPDLIAVVVDAGNPHIVLLAEAPPTAERCQALAQQIEASGVFPHGVNVGLAQRLGENPNGLILRVHERGAGLTPACGSGAAAAALAAHHAYPSTDHPIHVHQPGGSLVIDWQRSAPEPLIVSVTGPARLVFTGLY